MLATLVAEPFNTAGWVYEEKYDGHRILAYKEGRRVTLLSRNGNERTLDFPAVAEAVGKLKSSTLLLDGEAVVFDRQNVSRFRMLQRSEGRVTFAVFDCLYAKGRDLRRKPLSARRVALCAAVRSGGVLLLSRRLADHGLKAFQIAKRRGYEGLVAKDSAAAYTSGRSRNWLKVKVHHEDEFVIGGFTAPSGSRKHFGALLLGVYKSGKLRYVGKVGTGFDHQTLAGLHKKFDSLVRARSPFVDPPREPATFLAPKLIAQIAYTEWTVDSKLRHPVFLALRDDKRPREVIFPGPAR